MREQPKENGIRTDEEVVKENKQTARGSLSLEDAQTLSTIIRSPVGLPEKLAVVWNGR